MIYLDYNSTTPVAPEVLEKMLPYFSEKFGNASSSTHSYGWVAKSAVETAQQQVAGLIGCEAQQLLFTSGSTEAINLAIKGLWALYSPRKGKHIITCKTEHKAVLDVCEFLEKKAGARVTYLDVDANGSIDIEALKAALTDETILVSIMLANNETGVIQPMRAISNIVHDAGSILMSDATQAIGKIPVNVDELGIDLLCLSGHKFYGPKGVGALFFRRRSPRVALEALIHGGGHQRNLRSGTLNVAGIVGLGAAAEFAQNNLENFQSNTLDLRDFLEQQFTEHFQVHINGKEALRLANTSNISFSGKAASRIIEVIKGSIAVSTGSACTSEVMEPSHVLKAMGLSDADSYASIRFSLGWNTTKADILQVFDVFKARLNDL